MVRMKNSPVLVENLMDKRPYSISCGSTHTAVSTSTFLIFDSFFSGWLGLHLGRREEWSFGSSNS